MDVSPGNIPLSVYGRLTGGDLHPYVKIAVPTVVGDTYQGKYRIVGTTTRLFGYAEDGQRLNDDQTLEYRPGERFEVDRGRVFAAKKFEAVVGSDIPRLTHSSRPLDLDVTFLATHGAPKEGETPDIHAEVWKVVGVLKPTHTAADRVIYIPMNSFYTIAEHGVGLVAQDALRGRRPS